MKAKKFGTHSIGIILLLFLSGIPALSLDLDFKLSGGYTYIDARNINRGLEDWAEWRKREAEENKNWMYLSQNVKSLHSGIQLEGELLLSFSSRLGISVGTGYLYGDLKEKDSEVLIQRVTGPLSQVHPITLSAYPLVLSAYYFFPLNSVLHFYIRGGGGLAWAKYVNREAKKLESVDSYNYFRLERATAQGPIIQGGFGIVYQTEIGVRFFLEALARRAKIKGFTGENQAEESGTLYYFEEYLSDFDLWQAKNEIREEKPSGSNFRSVSEALVDFSGLSVKIGFIIRF